MNAALTAKLTAAADTYRAVGQTFNAVRRGVDEVSSTLSRVEARQGRGHGGGDTAGDGDADGDGDGDGDGDPAVAALARLVAGACTATRSPGAAERFSRAKRRRENRAPRGPAPVRLPRSRGTCAFGSRTARATSYGSRNAWRTRAGEGERRRRRLFAAAAAGCSVRRTTRAPTTSPPTAPPAPPPRPSRSSRRTARTYRAARARLADAAPRRARREARAAAAARASANGGAVRISFSSRRGVSRTTPTWRGWRRSGTPRSRWPARERRRARVRGRDRALWTRGTASTSRRRANGRRGARLSREEAPPRERRLRVDAKSADA